MATERRLRVGTRGSRLALWQADRVIELLAAAGLAAERVVVHTTGDRILDTPLAKIGDKGLFTKELEERLLEDAIDVAVHSLKDLPTQVPRGLVLGAVLEREDPSDALVCPAGHHLDELPEGARIGTSSLRRRAQLLLRRPDLDVRDLRGNVPTRLSKLDQGDYDAVVMARAGLLRLGLGSRITETIDPAVMLPAVGQGAIGVEAREVTPSAEAWLEVLDHRLTHLATSAERGLLGRLEGGCQVPIGALATWEGRLLRLRGLVAGLDGEQVVSGEEKAEVVSRDDARHLGESLANRLLAEGADRILDGVRAASGRDTISLPSSEERA
jgi:hydroxymethylbilane synthase